MNLPEPDKSRLRRRKELIALLRKDLQADQIIDSSEDLVAYECDALSAYRQRPMLVTLPDNTAQVSAVLKACCALDIPIVPWGAGTGLSGGALPREDGVVLSTARLRQVLDIDLKNRTITVQPGVTNWAVTEAVEQYGFYYAPDPSSQIACSIGGNIAENSGGVHCLKYGTCLLYTSPSPRDATLSRMPSSA